MSSDFCIKCDNELSVYCGPCVDAVRAEVERIQRELTDCEVAREALRNQRDEARAELLSATQQLELEREASAQLRAELSERMRETAEAQREACAKMIDRHNIGPEWGNVARMTRLVTNTKADGGTP